MSNAPIGGDPNPVKPPMNAGATKPAASLASSTPALEGLLGGPSGSAGAPGGAAGKRLVVYRHSNLFYWWPVWLVGFLFSIITWISGERLAVVPGGTEAALQRKVDVDGQDNLQPRDVLILAEKAKLRSQKIGEEIKPVQPHIHMVGNKTLGTVFVILLVLIITVTNVPIKGLWSVFFLVVVVMGSAIFAAAGWWEIIFDKLALLAIYINLGGYLFLSTVLFILWIFNFTVFDRQIYMIFTPGQVRVRLEIGGEETVYDTLGMVVQKTRTDVFRHWLLGFGSGDLIVRPAGVGHALELPNVMNVAKVVREVEKMVTERVVVTAPTDRPS